MPAIPIERLCSHHVVDGFKCGDDAFDIILQEYHEHIYTLYDDVAVLATVQGLVVTGYIAHKDTYVEHDGENLRMFLIPAFAVTVEHQGRGSGRRLVSAAFDALDRRREAGHEYDGIACIPHTSPSIERLLRRLDFGPLGDNSFFWWRRIRPE